MKSHFTPVTSGGDGDSGAAYAEYLTAELSGGGGSRYSHYLDEGKEALIGDSVWLGSGADHLGLDGNVSTEDLTAAINGWVQDADGNFVDTDRGRVKTVEAARKEQRQLTRTLKDPDLSKAERKNLSSKLTKLSNQLRDYDGDNRETKLTAFAPEQNNLAFDFTISNAKATSLLLSDAETHDAVMDAHHRAVARVVEEIEGSLAQTRRGAGGVIKEAVRGVTAAAITHKTSRPIDGDPEAHLHAHVVVVNKAQAVGDDKWLTLDWMPISKNKAVLEAVYTAEISRILAEEHGITWRAVKTENAVHADVWLADGQAQRDITAMFSGRQEQLKDLMMEARLEGKRMSEVEAWAKTREAKSPDPKLTEAMQAEWKYQLEANLDMSYEEFLELNRARLAGLQKEYTKEGFFEAVRDSAQEVADRRGTFTADELFRHINEYVMPYYAGVVSADELKQAVNKTLRLDITEEQEMVADYGDERTVITTRYPDDGVAGWAVAEFTTVGQLEVEASAMHSLREMVGREIKGGLDAEKILEWLQRSEARHGFELSDAQLELLVSTLNKHTAATVGNLAAGAGKSTVSAISGAIWLAENPEAKLVVLSTARKAAGDLAQDIQAECEALGIDPKRVVATSLHGAVFKEGEAEGVIYGLEANDMVICDEIGMGSSRHLSTVLAEAHRAGANFVGIGDTSQLASPGAAGGLLLRAANEQLVVSDTNTIRNRDEKVRELQKELRASILNEDSELMDTVAAAYEARGEVQEMSRGEMLAALRADVLAEVDRIVLARDLRQTAIEEAADEFGGLSELARRLGVDTDNAGIDVVLEVLNDSDRYVKRVVAEAAMQRGVSPLGAKKGAEDLVKHTQAGVAAFLETASDEEIAWFEKWLDAGNQKLPELHDALRILTASRASSADVAALIKEVSVERGLLQKDAEEATIHFGGRELGVQVGEAVMVHRNAISAEVQARVEELTDLEKARHTQREEARRAQVEAKIAQRVAAVQANMEKEGYSQSDIKGAVKNLADSMAFEPFEFSLAAAMKRNPELANAVNSRATAKMVNGTVWKVEKIREDGSLVLRGQEGQVVSVDEKMIASEILSPASCSTLHKAQGISVDRSLVALFGEDVDLVTAEGLNVGLTRHKQGDNGISVYIDDNSDPLLEAWHARQAEAGGEELTDSEVRAKIDESPTTFREILGKISRDKLALDQDLTGREETLEVLSRDRRAAARLMELRGLEEDAAELERLAQQMAEERLKQEQQEVERTQRATREQTLVLRHKLRD